jgi:hypothetical protein
VNKMNNRIEIERWKMKPKISNIKRY